MLDNIIDNLRDGMDDIINTLRKIKPEQGQINISNLRLVLEKFTNKCNIDTNLKIEGDLNEINLVYWRSIIECINEVLTNSMKYSNGDLINIEISVLNKIIRLYIKDNGCYQGDIKKGMGLLGIEERIVNLGGDVYFNNEDSFSNLIILKRWDSWWYFNKGKFKDNNRNRPRDRSSSNFRKWKRVYRLFMQKPSRDSFIRYEDAYYDWRRGIRWNK